MKKKMTEQARRHLEFLAGMGVSININAVRAYLGDGRALEEWLRHVAVYEYAKRMERK